MSGHLTPTQGGNLIIGSLNLTADNELKAGAASTCGEMPINDELGSPYFDFDIDHVLILSHLAQELLELAATFGADFTL